LLQFGLHACRILWSSISRFSYDGDDRNAISDRCFGPISDNAGIAEMSELPKEVRTRTDILIRREYDCSNWKGFAIASAANFIGIICSLCDFYRN
jgi:Na+/H+-translocating membrane pyrophosphatase